MVVALNQIVVPELRKRGFTGRFPHFRRIVGSRVDLLSFQFGRKRLIDNFVIEISQCPAAGFSMNWGEFIAASKATSHHMSGRYRWRLLPVKASPALQTNEEWFNFEQGDYQAVANSVLPFLEEGQWWWAQPRDLSKVVDG